MLSINIILELFMKTGDFYNKRARCPFIILN